jgi:hypothetical protein
MRPVKWKLSDGVVVPGAILLSGAALILLDAAGWVDSGWPLVIGTCALPTTIFGVWVCWLKRKYMHLGDYGFLICPRCRYPFKGLPDHGNCPECGREYRSLAEVREYWYRAGAGLAMPDEEEERSTRTPDHRHDQPP